jgi:hypothetical protein
MPREICNVPSLSNPDLRTQIYDVNGDQYTVVPLNQPKLNHLWKDGEIQQVRVSASTLDEMIELQKGLWRVSSKYLPVSANNLPYVLAAQGEAIVRKDMAFDRGASLSVVTASGDPSLVLEWIKAGVSICTDSALGLFTDQVIERQKEEARNQQFRSRAKTPPHPPRRPLTIMNNNAGPHAFVASGDPRVERLNDIGIGDRWDVLSTVKTYCDPGYAPSPEQQPHLRGLQYTAGAGGFSMTREQMEHAYANRYTSEEVTAWCRKNNLKVPCKTGDTIGAKVKHEREDAYNAVILSQRPRAFYTDSDGRSLPFSNPIVEDYQVLLDALDNKHYKQICGLMPPAGVRFRFDEGSNFGPRPQPSPGNFEAVFRAMNIPDGLKARVTDVGLQILKEVIERLEPHYPDEVMAFANARAEGRVSYDVWAGLEYLLNTIAPEAGVRSEMKQSIDDAIARVTDASVRRVLHNLLS